MLPSAAPMKTLNHLPKEISNTAIPNEEEKLSPNKDSILEKQPPAKIVSKDAQIFLQTE